jgi:hypothetical protein
MDFTVTQCCDFSFAPIEHDEDPRICLVAFTLSFNWGVWRQYDSFTYKTWFIGEQTSSVDRFPLSFFLESSAR